MNKILATFVALGALAAAVHGQVLLSGGLTYSQNFDGLSNSPVGTTYTWTDNSTPGLGAGWYASRAYQSGTTSPYGPFAYGSYRVGDGSANNGWIWSFGVAGVNPVEDRALGSIGSGTPKTNVFGLRIANDTPDTVGNITISYTGEQWRNGGNTAAQTLAFSYQVSSAQFASPIAVDGAGWTGFAALNFITPITGATAAPLDGNAAANRTVFTGIVLTGVTVDPNQEIFLRWLDIDDSGNDHGFGVDDFSVSFSIVPEPATAVLGGLGLLGLTFLRRSRR